MDDLLRDKIALFRYGIIAPLLTGLHQSRTKEDFYQDASAQIKTNYNDEPYTVAPGTIEKWYIKYKKYGLDGLRPKKRRDEGAFRKVPEQVVKTILDYKKTFPKAPNTLIYEKLNQDGIIRKKEVSPSTINRVVNALVLENNMQVDKDRRRYEKEHINELWCGDSSVGPYLTINGKKTKTYMIALIDDASRMIVGIKLFENDNFVNLMSVMKSAILKYGKPKVFHFDNGKPYRNTQMELLVARIGCTIRYCEPYSPESKSKIERWFRTCKEKWMSMIDRSSFTSIEQAEISLQEFVNRYNNDVHSSLGKSPCERFFEEQAIIKRLSDKEIAESFYLEIQRKVSADSIINIDSKLYEVPYIYAKQRLTIRYSYDMSEVFIVQKDNKLQPITLVNKIENARIKREKVKFSEEIS